MFRLNDDVLGNTLMCWIGDADLCFLDSAICNHTFRPNFLTLLRSKIFSVRGQIFGMRWPYHNWLLLRRLKGRCLIADDIFSPDSNNRRSSERNVVILDLLQNFSSTMSMLSIPYGVDLIPLLTIHGDKLHNFNLILGRNVVTDKRFWDEIFVILPNLKHLRIAGYDENNIATMELIHKHLPNLQSICFDIGRGFSGKILESTVSLFHNLRILKASYVTDEQLILIADKCFHLRKFSIIYGMIVENSAVIYFANKCNNLTEFSFHANSGNVSEGLSVLMEKCTLLENISITACFITNAVLLSVSKSCSRLKSLRVGTTNPDKITSADDAVSAIAYNCSETLTTLRLKHIVVTDQSVLQIANWCKKLESLIITDAPGVTDFSVHQVIEKCLNLTALDCFTCSVSSNTILNAVKGFTSVTLSGRPLLAAHEITHKLTRGKKQAKFHAFTVKLSDRFDINIMGPEIALQYPNIIELNLHDYDVLREDTLIKMLTLCPLLEEIGVFTCTNLDTSALAIIAEHCGPKLVSVTCFGATGLINTDLCALVERRPLLEQITLQNCFQLTDISLHKIALCCRNLQKLNVNGCKHVTNDAICDVITKCVRLRKLDLDHCDKITSRIFNTISEYGHNLRSLTVCRDIPEDDLKTFVLGRRHKLYSCKRGFYFVKF